MDSEEKPQKTAKTEIDSSKTAPVVNYLTLLMLAGFLLLVMTFLMEQRDLSEGAEGLRTSVSIVQEIDGLDE